MIWISHDPLDVCVNELLLVVRLAALVAGLYKCLLQQSFDYAEWYVGYLARLQLRTNIIVFKGYLYT